MLPVGSYAGVRVCFGGEVLLAASFSHIGKVRKNNEDAVLCLLQEGLFAVADGIGGHDNGEIASAAAVAAIEKLSRTESADDIPSKMREAFYSANDLIYKVGTGKQNGSGMGTTLTAAWIDGGFIYITHVGDSRAYLINEGGISLLSEDHSLVGELVRSGKLNLAGARRHPKKNILTRSLGQAPVVELYENKTLFSAGDYLLICSDGLYNPVAEDEMFAVVLTAPNLQAAVKSMTDRALERGGTDNISMVLVAHD